MYKMNSLYPNLIDGQVEKMFKEAPFYLLINWFTYFVFIILW